MSHVGTLGKTGGAFALSIPKTLISPGVCGHAMETLVHAYISTLPITWASSQSALLDHSET